MKCARNLGDIPILFEKAIVHKLVKMQEGLVILSARYGALEAIRKAEQQEQGEQNSAGLEGPSAPESSEQTSSAHDRFTPEAAGDFSPIRN